MTVMIKVLGVERVVVFGTAENDHSLNPLSFHKNSVIASETKQSLLKRKFTRSILHKYTKPTA